MADGRDSAPRRPSIDAAAANKRALANEQRLVALGEAVDQRAGIKHKPHRAKSRRGRRWIIAGVVVVGLIVGLLGGGYLYANWRWSQIHKLVVPGEQFPVPGQPFNILSIGSDSRAGLSGAVAAQTGANTGQAAGQRSDVIKIMHVDPNAGTITILSIPRDTTVTLLANQALYGKFNRINVNYGNGPALLAQTITANFGIPINYTIQVSFGGLINAAVAIGGVYLNFPYPAKDPYSGLKITHSGCQLVDGFQALAVARSRHYYWYQGGVWNYDGTSDFGRIDRQNAFLRAMLSRVKGSLANPFKINAFLSKVPQGVAIDSRFSLNEMIGLALKFHGLNPAAMNTYTLPEVPAVVNGADLLFVDQPSTQQLLVNIFGKQLLAPTNPPPNTSLQTPMPPVITPTTTTSVPKATGKKKHAPTTTTTNPTLAVPSFDPVPCTP